jgi:hypothetical protein
MSITLTALMKQRYDTAANWTTANPTLLAGEIGIESDTKKWKLGDGSTAWTSLGYIPGLSISAYPLVNADIASNAEIAVSKLADGAARQLLQTDAAGTGVEWASNIDIPGTLDVTGAATFDAAVTTTGLISANGKVSFPLGTAALPSLYPGTDTNTGIYSPGADQVAISTNGSERLRIDSTGRLGLGTSSATARMTVGDGNIDLTNSSASASQVREVFNFINPSASVSSSNGINFGFRKNNTFPGRGASIRMFQNGTSDGGGDASTAIGFWTYLLGIDNGVERMRLTGTGLGIGTTAPKEELSVIGDINVGNLAGTYGLDNSGTYEGLQVISSTKKPSVTLYSTQGSDGDAGEVRFVGWNVSGNVNSQAYIRNIQSSSSSVNPAGSLAFGTASVNSNAVERARIDSSGRLLVGTSSGTSLVQIDSGSLGTSGDGTTGALRHISRRSGTVGSIALEGRGAADAATPDGAGPKITYWGWDGANRALLGEIGIYADGQTVATGDSPGRLVFSTTADGASSPTERLRITNAGVLQVADAGNIAVGTTTGTKIGTATTQKLGFYNATPVVQPTAVADATDAASVITQLNALLTRMRNLGLIAT